MTTDLSPRLQVMEQVLSCTRCDLHAQCSLPVPFSGPDDARIVVLGEAPGQQEDEQGAPFVGPSGQIVRDALERVSIDPTTVAYVNTASCFPHGTPTSEQVDACRPNVAAQLDLIRPSFVLATGKVAMTALSSRLGKMKYARRRPFVVDVPDRVFVGSYHPAAGLHNPKVKEDFVGDVEFFAKVVFGCTEGRAWPEFIPDTCAACAAPAYWYGQDGLTFCEVHMPAEGDAWKAGTEHQLRLARQRHGR